MHLAESCRPRVERPASLETTAWGGLRPPGSPAGYVPSRPEMMAGAVGGQRFTPRWEEEPEREEALCRMAPSRAGVRLPRP